MVEEKCEYESTKEQRSNILKVATGYVKDGLTSLATSSYCEDIDRPAGAHLAQAIVLDDGGRSQRVHPFFIRLLAGEFVIVHVDGGSDGVGYGSTVTRAHATVLWCGFTRARDMSTQRVKTTGWRTRSKTMCFKCLL